MNPELGARNDRARKVDQPVEYVQDGTNPPPYSSSYPKIETELRVPNSIWVCLKMLCTPTPNGFADHYPYEKWLFHWETLPYFQTSPFGFVENWVSNI